MLLNRRNGFKPAQFCSFFQKLSGFVVILLWGAVSFGAERPSISVLTFSGDNAWEGMQAIYRPIDGGLYRTDKIESTFRLSNLGCEDDLLGQRQKRALEVMLENGYIPRELYDLLLEQRIHDMRQYILVTLFIDLPKAEVERRGIPLAKQMEEFATQPGEVMVRIHEGSLSAVRGYDIKRSGVDSFSVKDLKLPWEVGQLPTTLVAPLDRTHLPGAIEFGRALVEEGAPRDYFPLMMKAIVSALAADLRVLGIDSATVPAMAHAYDSDHARLFSQMFRGRPMTPKMQKELETNPKMFLAGIQETPMPNRDGWSQFDDTVVVNSIQNLIEQYPVDSISSFSNELKNILPASVTAEQRQTLIQELASSTREDYDFIGHDERQPGRRSPIQVHDYGTGLFMLKILHAIRKAKVTVTDQIMSRVVRLISEQSLKGDPDFSQGEWLEKQIYAPLPPYKAQPGELIPAIVVSNLDPEVPSTEVESYLGKILVSLTEKINLFLKDLFAEDQRFLLREMNLTRARRSLTPLQFLSLPAFLETYDLVFATSDESLAIRIKMLGGTFTKAIKIVQLDPKHLEDVIKNPKKILELLQHLKSTVQSAPVYRFKIEEVEEQLAELGPPAAHSLVPSFHPQKMLRYFITYQ